VGISRAELTARVAAGAAPLVLDVRSAQEFARGRIPGATHLPFWPGWPSQVASVPPDALIVVYCGHGPRAWWAARRLRRRGFTNVQVLAGHMQGWRQAGLEEERS